MSSSGSDHSELFPPLEAPRSESVLKSVRGRSAQRRRRRGDPPAWLVRTVDFTLRIRRFIRSDLREWAFRHRRRLAVCGASLLLHLLIAGMLSLCILDTDSGSRLFSLIASAVRSEDIEDAPLIEAAELLPPEKLKPAEAESTMQQMLGATDDARDARDLFRRDDRPFEMDLIPTDMEMDAFYRQGDFGGRSEAGKRASLKKYGGTQESERAVGLGLEYLRSLQQGNGSWDLTRVGNGATPGTFPRCETAATSMALLCFLGAGHTHTEEGPYQQVVRDGLRYLGESAQVEQGRYADLTGNASANAPMYAQGLAAICLCEAHALDPDNPELKMMAEWALNFIERAQDPRGGGWRYRPRDPGDLSVTGWQIMALYSGKAGGLKPSGSVLRKAHRFLSSIQAEGGAEYRYDDRRDRNPKKSMTAVGLLCRMYMGWKRDHDPLKRGVAHLAALGPDPIDMYHNYYATQVLHHYGGPLWENWNKVMREQLVRTQLTEGPAAGSWPVTDPHGGSGGQIYQTALSVLTLEVYYRHLPLYREITEAADPAE